MCHFRNAMNSADAQNANDRKSCANNKIAEELSEKMTLDKKICKRLGVKMSLTRTTCAMSFHVT